MKKTKLCIWLLSISILVGNTSGRAQDPLEIQVQAQKDQEKERQKQAALSAQQKQREEQERQKQEVLREQERQKQEALKIQRERLKNSAVLSKDVYEKMSFRDWLREGREIDPATGRSLNQVEPIKGLKAKLSRVYFHKSHSEDHHLVLDSIELWASGKWYTMSYEECSEDEHLYIQAFMKLWRKEHYRRTWTDSTGKFKTDASFEGVDDDKVKLVKDDGTVIQLPVEKFSAEDQEWIKNETTVRTPREIVGALAWLANHQMVDGSWNLQEYQQRCAKGDRSCTGVGNVSADAGATAMGLLPFFGMGRTPMVKAPYKEHVFKGIKWLIAHQQADGNLAKGTHQMMYSHGLATIALCEAYGLTGDKQVGRAAQGAVNFILEAQNAADGGWRYNPKDPGDTCVTGWQLTALTIAQKVGLRVGGSVFSGTSKWLDSVSVRDGTEYEYQPGRGPSNTMTSVGLRSRQYLGAKRDDVMLIGGMKYLMNNLPDDTVSPNIYYWHYATLVMHDMSGHEWDIWSRRICELLVRTQVRDVSECANGSWAPERDSWGSRGGRIMTTALSCLTLESCYGYEFQPLSKSESISITPSPEKPPAKMPQRKRKGAGRKDLR